MTRVCVLPGDALVARSGDAVLVVDLDDPGRDDVRRTLLETVAEVCGAGRPATGELARRLIAAIMAVPRQRVPAFGVAAPSSLGVDVLLVGDVVASWTDGRGDHRVSGRQGTNWVDLLVPPGVERLVVGREGVSGEGHQLADLRDGAVVGGGAVVELTPSPPDAEPAAAGAAAEPERADAEADAEPEPAAAGAAAEAEPGPAAAGAAAEPERAAAAGAAPEAEPERAAARADAEPERAAPGPAPDAERAPAAPPRAPEPPAAEPEPTGPVPDAGEASIHTGGGPAVPAPPAEERPEPEPAPFVSVHFGDDVEPEEREPLPVAGDAASVADERAAPPGVTAGPAIVPGIRCAVGHFNHPDSRYCVVCGRGFDQGVSRIVTAGPRPPLGVLVIDDGAAFVLDADYVIGREPELDPDVPAGQARPLNLTDPNRTVSRVHAEVRLDGWDVLVVDRGSTNGTYLLLPGAPQWTRVPPAGRAVVPPGARVAVGQRTFVYESHHVGIR